MNQPIAGLRDRIIKDGECLYLKCQETNLVPSECTDEELGQKKICIFPEDTADFL
jgi:hypothetical protein